MSDELQMALTALVSALATGLAAWARQNHVEKRRPVSELTDEQIDQRVRQAEDRARKEAMKEVMVKEIHTNSERTLEANERAANAMERVAEVFVLVKQHMDSDHDYQKKQYEAQEVTNKVLAELLRRTDSS